MIEFWTLGTFALRTSDGCEYSRLLARPKCLAVLAYLAASARSHVHSRETLLGVFWPELDQEHARLALRQALHVLRRELGDGVLVARGSAMLGVDSNRLWCDTVAYDYAFRTGDYLRALELYRGDFLAGMFIPGAREFERWLSRERAWLRARAASAAWALAEEMEAARAAPHAAYWARRAVELAPEDEHGIRRLVALLDRLGDSAGALRAYEDFSRWLASELELAPSPETRALAQAIQARLRSLPGEPRLLQRDIPINAQHPSVPRPHRG